MTTDTTTDEWDETPPALPPGYKLRTAIGMVTTGAALGATITATALILGGHT